MLSNWDVRASNSQPSILKRHPYTEIELHKIIGIATIGDAVGSFKRAGMEELVEVVKQHPLLGTIKLRILKLKRGIQPEHEKGKVEPQAGANIHRRRI